MTPAGKARLALAVAALPMVAGAVAVRPAVAQSAPEAYADYALTGVAAAVRTNGDVGAGGDVEAADQAAGGQREGGRG